ncbi:uncharacterized protein LOC133174616 [Saccostrea echinata]|uniref:uncharacterized protein LOC133174616 n=1 Tax=Saccostrea echinata TaxID=191078 RepID=UPI002A7EB6AD|nr:uncharacterized protein LOC133174616 [Saccostrea echinata]
MTGIDFSGPLIVKEVNKSPGKAAALDIDNIFRSNRVQNKLSSLYIVWKFIPDTASWYGGWWRRIIGTKSTIKKVLGKAQVTSSELNTLLTEMECMLNNKPITYTFTDLEDPQPLISSHLLYGRSLDVLPYFKPPDESLQPFNMKSIDVCKRVARQRDVLNHFWNIWRNEDSTSLRESHRAAGRTVQDIKVGDVVLVHNGGNRLLWKLGTIKELIYGRGKYKRVATVMIDTGLINRHLTKLYPLKVSLKNGLLR